MKTVYQLDVGGVDEDPATCACAACFSCSCRWKSNSAQSGFGGIRPISAFRMLTLFIETKLERRMKQNSKPGLPIVLLLLRISDECDVVVVELQQEPMLTSTEPVVVVVAVRRPT